MGNGFCRHVITIDICPAAIKKEVAQRNIEREEAAILVREAEGKLKQAQEERAKADALLKEAAEERKKAQSVLLQIQEEQKRQAEARRQPSPSPPEASEVLPEEPASRGSEVDLPPHLRRQIVRYQTNEPPATIVIDTSNSYLYLVLGNGQAFRYGVVAPAPGYKWSGVETITRMAEWPDWRPTKEAKRRQPYLPDVITGGPGNPLGARALYLGNTLYRIHGTNQTSKIGSAMSTGSFAMLDDDVMDLYARVQVGTRVVVLP